MNHFIKIWQNKKKKEGQETLRIVETDDAWLKLLTTPGLSAITGFMFLALWPLAILARQKSRKRLNTTISGNHQKPSQKPIQQ